MASIIWRRVLYFFRSMRHEFHNFIQNGYDHTVLDYIPDDGTHAQRWNEKSGWYLDSESNYSHDHLKYQGQREFPHSSVDLEGKG